MTGKPRGLTELEALDAVFGALAHRSRRTILAVLLARGGEMTSGEIAGRFDHSWPTITRHLRILEEAGLVRVSLRGRERRYVLDVGRLEDVAGGWLARFRGEGARGRDARSQGARGQVTSGRRTGPTR